MNDGSRYAGVEVLVHREPDGRAVRYYARRLPPPLTPARVAGEVVVTEGDRVDLIAWRTLGDPLAFWRIADVNGELNPFDLVREYRPPAHGPLSALRGSVFEGPRPVRIGMRVNIPKPGT